MRRVIFYSVETFVDDTRVYYPWEVYDAMVYTPPLMRKYKHVKFNRFSCQCAMHYGRCVGN